MSRLLPLASNTDVVTLVIEVGGQELPRSLPLRSVEVYSQVNRIPYARIRVSEGDPALGDFQASSGELSRTTLTSLTEPSPSTRASARTVPSIPARCAAAG